MKQITIIPPITAPMMIPSGGPFLEASRFVVNTALEDVFLVLPETVLDPPRLVALETVTPMDA